MKEKFEKDLKFINQRIQRLGAAAALQNTNEDEQMEDQMSIKRIQNMDKEFELLNYCFSASLILFKEI
jgi:hypothetical protein